MSGCQALKPRSRNGNVIANCDALAAYLSRYFLPQTRNSSMLFIQSAKELRLFQAILHATCMYELALCMLVGNGYFHPMDS